MAHITPSLEENPSPQDVQALLALFNGARYMEAATLAQAVTRRFPRHAFGWKVLGATLKQLGRNADALAPMQRAVALSPQDAEAQNNLGAALQDLGRFDEAAACSRRALQIRPNFAEAHSNLGNALRDLGQLDEAVASYRRAVAIRPDYAMAHSNLGNALTDLGRLEEAIASCCRALEIEPDYAEAHTNLGVALYDLGRLDEAVANYRRALEIKPDFVQAHNNLGSALEGLGQPAEAVASYRRALEIKPDFAMAHSNLGNALTSLGRFAEAVTSYRRALEIKPDYCEAHSNLLFLRSYQSDQPAAKLLDAARRFGDLVTRQARPFTSWPNVRSADRCLRVGLVSGDLCSHPVGYFLESVLAALHTHAADRLNFFAYPSTSRNDAVTSRIKTCCHGWHSAVGLSDQRLAQRIREDGIDILFDLAGHTAHNRLPMFVWKPAPVQASWIGYLGTTGVAAMDYIIADPWTLPESEAPNFTEKIWRLPESYLCFTRPDTDLNVSATPAIANGYVTFGCFNNLSKMNDAVVALWARILREVPASRLFLKTMQLNQEKYHEYVGECFASHGIDPRRLILEGSAPRVELLSTYRRVDIALDPFPYPGITTSIEALWMGVPVLTMAGKRFLSRQGVGIMMNVGLPEWIAVDPDDYVTKAVAQAGDLKCLTRLRGGLRQRTIESPLFDALRFGRHFEAALRVMWMRWCDGKSRV
jgi:protein O-GlcNAc transferase